MVVKLWQTVAYVSTMPSFEFDSFGHDVAMMRRQGIALGVAPDSLAETMLSRAGDDLQWLITGEIRDKESE